jgi:hypothetical protein
MKKITCRDWFSFYVKSEQKNWNSNVSYRMIVLLTNFHPQDGTQLQYFWK